VMLEKELRKKEDIIRTADESWVKAQKNLTVQIDALMKTEKDDKISGIHKVFEQSIGQIDKLKTSLKSLEEQRPYLMLQEQSRRLNLNYLACFAFGGILPTLVYMYKRRNLNFKKNINPL